MLLKGHKTEREAQGPLIPKLKASCVRRESALFPEEGRKNLFISIILYYLINK